MAEIVASNRAVRRRSSLYSYPWDEWTNGKRWEAFQGIDGDFTVSLKSFRLYLYKYKEMINKGQVPQPGQARRPRDLSRVPQWKVETDLIVETGAVQFRFVRTGMYADLTGPKPRLFK